MAKLNINIGSSANDKTGDPLRTAFSKVNANFTELYALSGSAASVQELVQDYAAPLLTHAGHSGISFVYDDILNKIVATVSVIPTQLGNSGRYLTTDGVNLAWSTVATDTISNAGATLKLQASLGRVVVSTGIHYELFNGSKFGEDNTSTTALSSMTGGKLILRTTNSLNTVRDWEFSDAGNLKLPATGNIFTNGGVAYNDWANITGKPTSFTGYDNEVHVSGLDGNDTTGNGDLLTPVASITKALTLVTGERRTVIVHPGTYTENPTITYQYTVLTGPGLLGGNIVISGTVTATTGCTITGLKMTNLTSTVASGGGNLNILNCEISGTLTKSGSGDYTLVRLTDFAAATITGSGLVDIYGGNTNFVTVNNAAANVLIKNGTTVAPVVTAGSLSLVQTVVIAAVTNAVTSAAGTVVTLANSQILTSALTGVAPVVLNGFYSIFNCVYDKPGSTLVALSATGGSTNSVDYFQFINADRLILASGGRITFPDATVQTTAWTGSVSSLVNGVHTLSLGSTGNTTFPTGLVLGAPRGVNTVNFTCAVDKEFQIETGTASTSKLWRFGTDGTTTFPTNISINYSGGNVQFPRIIADSGKAFSVQGQGTSGSAALSWTVNPDAAGQYAAVAVTRAGGGNLATVVLQAQSNSGDVGTVKLWRFDETGALTLPKGSIINESQEIVTVTLDQFTSAGLSGTQVFNKVSDTLYELSPAGASYTRMELISGIWRLRVATATYYDSTDLITWGTVAGSLPTPVGTLTTVERANLAVDGLFWGFDGNGALTLPTGGVIEDSASYIKLTPAGGTNAYQSLLIYPTAVDGNHIHLAAPPGGTTELYLGNDAQYVKLVNGGSVEVRTFDGLGANPTWTFGTDGRTTFPVATVPAHDYGAAGDKAGMLVFDANYFYYCIADYVNNTTVIWKRMAYNTIGTW